MVAVARSKRTYPTPTTQTHIHTTMAIAPITGFMKRRIIIDISVGMALGSVLGVFWWRSHTKMVETRENYYAALAEKKKIEESI